MIEKEIHRIVKGIEAEFGVTCELTYTTGLSTTYTIIRKLQQNVVSSLRKCK